MKCLSGVEQFRIDMDQQWAGHRRGAHRDGRRLKVACEQIPRNHGRSYITVSRDILMRVWSPSLVLIALTTVMACVTLGGGVYEYLVVDPFWPRRPGIIQPAQGGITRHRFWVPAHSLFELLLIVSLVVTWSRSDVRAALLVALVCHALVRAWSLIDFVPKARRFERTDPSTVDQAAAIRWTRRSLFRLPLELAVCTAMLAGLASAV